MVGDERAGVHPSNHVARHLCEKTGPKDNSKPYFVQILEFACWWNPLAMLSSGNVSQRSHSSESAGMQIR